MITKLYIISFHAWEVFSYRLANTPWCMREMTLQDSAMCSEGYFHLK